MWVKVTLSIFAALMLVISGAIYHLVIDGTVPRNTPFEINLDQLRTMADAPPSQRPTAIHMEVLARDQIPRFAAQAGLDRSPLVMARTAFKLVSGSGDVLIDVGMDHFIARKYNTGANFDDEALERIRNAMATVRWIVVTHEHPDHLGLLARYQELDAIATKLKLTEEQFLATAQYADGFQIPPALVDIELVVSDKYSTIAPGIVLIPAAGHTPGSVMFFILMADGTEVLFLGDIVWNMSNIEDQKGRPRLVQQYLMQTPESRDAVYNQLSAIIAIEEQNPELVLIPSHDEDHITKLVERGILVSGF